MKLSILKIRYFINKESVYFLMLAFILLVNAWLIFAEKTPQIKESLVGEKKLELRLTKKTDDEDKYLTEAKEKMLWQAVLKKERHIPFLMNILALVAVLIFSSGLFLDIHILMAKIRRKKILKISTRHLLVKWEIWDIFKLAIIFVFLGYILNIIEANFFSFLAEEKSMLHFISLLNTGIMDLLFLGFILYFVKVKYGQSLSTLGLKIKQAHKLAFLGILSYIAFLPILVFILLLLIWLSSMFNYYPRQQELFKLFIQDERIWLLFFATFMVMMLGPIVEEVFFRGFAYNALKRRWGSPRAIAVTAIVFAGLHGNLIGFLPIIALGILLAYMYERTGSLIPSMTIHILHNTLMVTFLFLTRYFMRLTQ